jgi:hypothetical protein
MTKMTTAIIPNIDRRWWQFWRPRQIEVPCVDLEGQSLSDHFDEMARWTRGDREMTKAPDWLSVPAGIHNAVVAERDKLREDYRKLSVRFYKMKSERDKLRIALGETEK